MIEEKVREYLEDKLDIPVRMEEEPGLPEEYVLIEKTGSGEENHIASAALAIQSYSGSLYGAASLNERVKEAMEKIVEMDDCYIMCKTPNSPLTYNEKREFMTGLILYDNTKEKKIQNNTFLRSDRI